MYLIKAKKQIEQQDHLEFQEKKEKHAERQQRETPGKSPTKRSEEKKKKEFNFDELPDGACFRPKNVLDNITQDGETAVRPAEYIGSFSVTGNDQNARTEFVQAQLQNMQNVTKSKKVLIVISLSGVKVCSSDGASVYMAHALKRISYAACDPDYKQFSFLAREPKGHINMQFCHAFITKTSEEAEELNTIIGNAFKMAYAQQRDKQPTFNEIIEQQLVQQKAKFAEYQEQAQKALQQKLTEIATPTPLSEKGQQLIEMRRQSSSEDFDRETGAGKKVWAKHAVERVQHKSPVRDGGAPSPYRSESPTSVVPSPKRNSAPYDMSPSKQNRNMSSASNRNSSPHILPLQNIPVMTIRESLEKNEKSTNNSNRFKGSPVTALKNEIDRRYLSNGVGTFDSGFGTFDSNNGFNRDDSDSSFGFSARIQEEIRKPPPCGKMVNRPLPALPDGDEQLRTSPVSQRVSPRQRNWTSMDDDVIPNQSRSPQHQSRLGQIVLRDSPRRRPRPQSEVILDHKFSANLFGPGVDEPGMYIYGFKSQTNSEIHSQTVVEQSHKSDSPVGMGHGLKSKQGGYDNFHLAGSEGLSAELAMLRYQNSSPQQQSIDSTDGSSQQKQRPGSPEQMSRRAVAMTPAGSMLSSVDTQVKLSV